MFQDGSFVATGEVAAYSQGVAADTFDVMRLNLNEGGGDSKYLSSTATQIYFDIAGATPLSMTETEVRRGTPDNDVDLGTSDYPWANIYGVNLIASTDISTPKITLGNSWTIEQTATQVYFDIDGINPLSMTKTEVRRGTSNNNVNLGTFAYPWANIYGVNLIASTNLTTPKITLGNG